MNAYTYGEVKPFVAVSSSCIEKMEDDELQTIMAHECGHILCKHSQHDAAYANRTINLFDGEIVENTIL